MQAKCDSRPPLVWNWCKGTGHPQKVCGTPAGSTSRTTLLCCRGMDTGRAPARRMAATNMSHRSRGRPKVEARGCPAWTKPHRLQLIPSATSPGSIFASWAASRPWMASSVPEVIAFVQTSGWKVKVTQSLGTKLKAFEPALAPEDAAVEETETGIVMKRGVVTKCKNRKTILRPVKFRRNIHADKSFSR